MAEGLLDKANIILTPTGYKAGTMYNVAPIEQPYEDFVFSRASVASRVNSSGLVEMVGRTLGSNLVQNGDFSELGSELVTNGDFATDSDWNNNVGNDWQIVNGKLILTTTSYNNINQGIGLVQNKFYKIVFTIANTTLGGVRVRLGTGTITSEFTNGTHTIYLEQTTTNDAFRFYASSSGVFDGSIDNVSVKQVDPNDYWNLGAGWSLGDDEAIATNTTADSLYQDALTLGKTYKVSFEITEITSGSIRIGIGINFSQYFTTAGTYTYYGEPTFDGLLRINPTSSTNAKITNVTAQEIIDTNNIPRINYDSNGENGHWLLEPTSTNLITYSEDFSEWSLSNATVEGGYLAPDGSNSAYKVSGTVGSSSIYLGGVNATDTRTIWARTVSGIGTINLCSYGQNTNNNFTITEDWQRFEVNGTTTSTGGTNFYAVDFRFEESNPLSEVIIWGAQAENLPYATSYIPTLTGSTVTRATETATGAGSADLINSTEGVLYAEIAALANDGTYRFISLNGGGYSNSIRIGYFTTSNTVEYRVVDSNAKQVEITHVISDTTDTIKLAAKYKANDFALWINGVEVATDTSGTVPSNLYELDFNDGNASNNSPFYGKCKELAVFGEALSDDELEKLTSWSSFNAMATDLGYTIE